MKTFSLTLLLFLSSLFLQATNIETFYTQTAVITTYYDATNDILYAGGSGELLVFQNNTWSYFTPAPPFSYITDITIFNNELYIASVWWGVAKFNGTNWVELPTSYLSNMYSIELCVYNNKLYAYQGFCDSLTVWNGSTWSRDDLGVSSIGCHGVSKMFYYNNELYVSSASSGNTSIVLKKSGNQWIIPNNYTFNQGISLTCEFNNKLYVFDSGGEGMWEYDGLTWTHMNMSTSGGSVTSWHVRSMRSDGNRLYLAGGFSKLSIWPAGAISVNNIFSWCGGDLFSPIETGFPNNNYLNDFNFYNNKIYVFGWPSSGIQAPVSIIDSIDYLPTPEITVSDTSICEGESVELKEVSNTGAHWEWLIDGTNPSPTSKQKVTPYLNTVGYHTVNIKVSNCTGDSTRVFTNLINVKPIPPKPTILVTSDTLFSSSLYNNHWTINGVPQADTTNFLVHNITFHNYITVSVTNYLGCSNTSDYVTKIDEICPEPTFEIFPNPSSGLVTIKGHNSLFGEYQLKITTILGQEILSTKITFNPTVNLDLRIYPIGYYIVTIQNKEKIWIKKLILQ